MKKDPSQAQSAAEKKAAELRKAEVELAERLEGVGVMAAEKVRQSSLKADQKWLKAELKAGAKLRKEEEKIWRNLPTRRAVSLNLLAESQEEERRHENQAERVVCMGTVCVCFVLLWIFKLQLDIDFNQARHLSSKMQYEEISDQSEEMGQTLLESDQIEAKLAALDRLSSDRFHWAPFLFALDETKVDNIRVTRVSSVQQCIKEDPRAIGSGLSQRVIPLAVVEKISLAIEGRDTSPDQQSFIKYQQSINSCDYSKDIFKSGAGFTLAGTLKPRLADATVATNPFVAFVLTAHFPALRRGQ